MRPSSPATPTRGKRPTVARLRALNRAMKPIAPVTSTLRRTEAVIDMAVLDLESKAEEDRVSESEGNDVAIPSSAALISFDKVDHIQYIEPRGMQPEEPKTPNLKTPAESDDDADIIDDLSCSCCLIFMKHFRRRNARKGQVRGR